MHTRVTVSAQGDQILFYIGSRMTSELDVMYVQLFHAAADLASPPVTFQHLPMQFTVAGRIQSDSRAFSADLLHEAVRLTSERKPPVVGWAGTCSSE